MLVYKHHSRINITVMVLYSGRMVVYSSNVVQTFAAVHGIVKLVIGTVLQTKRVHFAFWHKLVYNFKITSSVLKKS